MHYNNSKKWKTVHWKVFYSEKLGRRHLKETKSAVQNSKSPFFPLDKNKDLKFEDVYMTTKKIWCPKIWQTKLLKHLSINLTGKLKTYLTYSNVFFCFFFAPFDRQIYLTSKIQIVQYIIWSVLFIGYFHTFESNKTSVLYSLAI